MPPPTRQAATQEARAGLDRSLQRPACVECVLRGGLPLHGGLLWPPRSNSRGREVPEHHSSISADLPGQSTASISFFVCCSTTACHYPLRPRQLHPFRLLHPPERLLVVQVHSQRWEELLPVGAGASGAHPCSIPPCMLAQHHVVSIWHPSRRYIGARHWVDSSRRGHVEG